MFKLSDAPLNPTTLRETLTDPRAGAYVAFEGWVRDHNVGREVTRLEYEAYATLAKAEGARIVDEALARHDALQAACVHRTGRLEIGELAVWVGVVAPHRDAAFAACRYIIDEVKARAPIWKKEFYVDGASDWARCEHCAAHAREGAATPAD